MNLQIQKGKLPTEPFNAQTFKNQETLLGGMTISVDEMAVFCKKKGLIFPNSEIYGGMAGFFDYGPLGAELKNNLKQAWWKFHVHDRDDVVGMDGAIITHPKVWVASGHVESFNDVMLECEKCHERLRGDHLIEDTLKIQADGLKAEDINRLVAQNKLACPKCKGKLKPAEAFNLMFKTHVGPVPQESAIAYLRPETAQIIFTNFRQVLETSRVKLPFGIAQMGRAFRNEIAPRQFLFRCREFEQMELEYFIDPRKVQDCPYLKDVTRMKLLVYSAEAQRKTQEPQVFTVKELVEKKIVHNPWLAYWLATEVSWFLSLGGNPKKFRIRQHLQDEKSHYAADTWDLEYEFPFGWKELQGMANRADFDLKQHIQHSKKDLGYFDEETKTKIVPHVVAEPSMGVDRAFLVFLYDAYEYDVKRGNIVLHLHPTLAPYKFGIFPLVNKMEKEARKIHDSLKKEFVCFYDRSGSVGRRYARADEIGIPYTITIDFDCKKNKDITIRDRESTKQVRVKQKDMKDVLHKLLEGEVPFEKAGKLIKALPSK